MGFHVELFQSKAAFEVNPVDLIALEVLRSFEPSVYRAVSGAKGLLTNLGDGGDRRGSARKAELDAIIDASSPSNRKSVSSLIELLFPTIEDLLGGSYYHSSYADRWAKELRVCSNEFFDRYFRFDIPHGDLSQAEFIRLIAATARRSDFVSEIRDLQDRGLAKTAFSRLDTSKQDIPIERASQFLPALIDVSDNLTTDRGFFDIDMLTHATRIFLWYLLQDPDEERRSDLTVAAIAASHGLALSARLIMHETEMRGRDDGQAMPPLLTDRGLDTARNMWVAKVEDRFSSDLLKAASKPHFLAHLYRLRDWLGPDTPRKYVSRLIETDVGLVTFLQATMTSVVSHSERDHVSRTDYRISLENIQNFASLEEVTRRALTLNAEDLTAEQKRAIDALRKATEKNKVED